LRAANLLLQISGMRQHEVGGTSGPGEPLQLGVDRGKYAPYADATRHGVEALGIIACQPIAAVVC
jgi:hypothetical protein